MYQNTWGQITDIDNSIADIQECTNRALLINDAMNLARLVYNARSLGTAVGADLDGLTQQLNIQRKGASSSTAVLTLVGTPGTQILNGVAQDVNGFLWTIPPVTIGSGGTVSTTATCQTQGNVTAPANTINKISQGTNGWLSVNNAANAATGQAIEQDSQYRARAQVSTALSAKTLVASTLAAIAAAPNVTRYAKGITSPDGTTTSVENPTGGADYFGNPAHSITMVVEGATDLEVATLIYNNKTPGCYTNGSTTVSVTDPETLAATNINFFRPTYVPIYVTLHVHGLNGYSSAVTTAIQTAVVNYLNELQIGESLTISGLYAAAMAVMPTILLPQFSIQSIMAATTPTPTTSTDIAIAFNAVVEGITGNVIVTVD